MEQTIHFTLRVCRFTCHLKSWKLKQFFIGIYLSYAVATAAETLCNWKALSHLSDLIAINLKNIIQLCKSAQHFLF